MLSEISRSFNLQPDPIDHRDIPFKMRCRGSYPDNSHQSNMLGYFREYSIDDQGSQGACAAFSYREAMRRVLQVNKLPSFDPSPEFIYYVARANKDQDSGLVLRDLMKAMVKFGACDQKLWKYRPGHLKKVPPAKAYKDAEKHQLIRYESLQQTQDDIKEAIYCHLPVIYGKAIYESFTSEETKATGIIPVPQPGEKLQGWHAQTILDYDSRGTLELNHWGREWGKGGTNMTPWEFVLNPQYARDFWVIYLTE